MLLSGLSTVIPAKWHAPCILSLCLLPLPSCLFWIGPIPYAVENMPPTILSQSDEDGATIEVGSLGRAVFVAAEDPEGGPIGFRWVLSNDGYVGNATEQPDVSQIWLEQDARYDGQELRCEISDDENATVTLRWRLVVLP